MLRVGPYQLVRELGRGAFGVVYLAQRDGLLRPCALKVTTALDPEARARFDLEARVASKLTHPGIVPVIDSGHAGGRAYYAMPYCEGPTLKQHLSEGPLSPEASARLLSSIARAVEHAHRQGVLHRDLKPDNVILVAPDGAPRLTDFGMARDRSLRPSLTKTGDVMGTPAYMAPEQWRGERGLDARADVYALGVILYQCLTGRRPFPGDSVTEVGQQVLEGRYEAVQGIAPDVPAALSEVCARAMATRREERFPSAEALAVALEQSLAPSQAEATLHARVATAGVLVVLGLAAALLIVALARQPEGASPASPAPADGAQAEHLPAASPAPGTPVAQVTRPARRLAPDDEVQACATLLIDPFRLVPRYGEPDAYPRLTGRLTELRDAFPQDPRVRGMQQVLELRDDRADPLVLRRELLGTCQDPRTPAPLVGVAARLSLELGFQRAACDLALWRVRPTLEHPWSGLTAMHVLVGAAPPARDVELACQVADQTLALLEARGQLRGDQAHPPAWDVLANQGIYRLHLGQRERAASALRQAAGLSEDPSRIQSLRGLCDAVESGRVPAERALNLINMPFPIGSFLQALAGTGRGTAAPQDAADAAGRSLALATREARDERLALVLVRAARYLEAAGRVPEAGDALERAAALRLGSEHDDVRQLVARTLARLLLEQGGDPSRAEQLALEATTPGTPEVTTAGELADAWVLVARARLARGDQAAAQQALGQAQTLDPHDRRELDASLARVR